VARSRRLEDTFLPGPDHKINRLFLATSPLLLASAPHPTPETRSGKCGFISATCASLGRNAKRSALAGDFLLSGGMSRSEVGVMG
jgi:hypothetical protein